MTFFSFRRRRRAVRAQHVTTLLRSLETLGSALGLAPDDHAAFAQGVFVTMAGADPDSVLEEVIDARDASAMEARLSHAAIAVNALSDFVGTATGT